MDLFNELQERVRKCGDDVNAIIEISTEMHKYNCRICPRNMYQDETSKQFAPPCVASRAAAILRYVGGLTLRKRTEAANENLLYMRSTV